MYMYNVHKYVCIMYINIYVYMHNILWEKKCTKNKTYLELKKVKPSVKQSQSTFEKIQTVS